MMKNETAKIIMNVDQVWQANLDALARHHPKLYQQLIKYDRKPIGDLVEAASGVVTLRFDSSGKEDIWAYGTEDPWQDAAIHLKTVESGSRGLVVFVGMGLGYGPLLVLRERPEISKMVILEPSLDLFCAAMETVDITPLIADPKVVLMAGEIDLALFEAVVSREAAIEDTHILRHLPSFQWGQKPYSALNERVFMLLNKLNAQGGTTSRIGDVFFRNRLKNLTLLRHCHSLDALKEMFLNKPAVLVAAGPSLDQSIPELKKVVGHCVLIAVDSALSPLLNAGIIPDFVTSIDFLDLNFEKMAPFLKEDWPFSLVVTQKVAPYIPKRFPARHCFLALQEDVPNKWILNSLGVKTLVPEAFSVAHLSFGLAWIMRADPIILVGQDLAYTNTAADHTAEDHAAGTVISGSGLPADKEIFYATGLDGNKLPTDRNLMSIQQKFEEFIAKYPGACINASAKGVHIKGAEVMTLEEVRDRFMAAPLPVVRQVDEAVRENSTFSVDGFERECHRNLKLIKGMCKDLAKGKEIAGRVIKQVTGLQKKHHPAQSFDELPSALAKQVLSFDQVNRSLDGQEYIWDHVLELTFKSLSDNDRLKDQNERLSTLR